MIEIKSLKTQEEYNAIINIQRNAWGMTDIEIDPPYLMERIQKYGGLAQGLFLDGECVGFTYGFLGKWKGELFLFSYMTAVKTENQGKGLGFLLKKAQREEVLNMGYTTIRWNFDPLEAQNAFFNLHRLGVICKEYEYDIYGEGESGLHRGLSTDRLVAIWNLNSERVVKKMSTKEPPIVELVPDKPSLDINDNIGYIEIPRDIRSLKKKDLELAKYWRKETGNKFEKAFGKGFVAKNIVFSENNDKMFYKLEKGTIQDEKYRQN